MHILNTGRLVSDLAKGNISESKSAEYYLANAVLGTLWAQYLHYFNEPTRDGWFFVQCAATLIVVVLGVASAYRANGGPDGRDFLLRTACLSVPIALKVNALSAGLVWLCDAYYFRVFDELTVRSAHGLFDLMVFMWGPGFTALFFWRLSARLDAVRCLSNSGGMSAQDASDHKLGTS